MRVRKYKQSKNEKIKNEIVKIKGTINERMT